MNNPFEALPQLQGTRILLRPLLETDWEPLFQAAADPLIWELHPAHDRYKETVFRDYFDQAMASALAYAFVDINNGSVIGSSRYHGFDPERSEVEIGWTFLSRAYWGGSYNAEIKHLMLSWAFQHVDTCIFWVGTTNWRSRRAMEKIGGQLREGTFQRSESPLPYVIYEISKKDFQRGEGSDPA